MVVPGPDRAFVTEWQQSSQEVEFDAIMLSFIAARTQLKYSKIVTENFCSFFSVRMR